jgi:ubiquinone/menaquinone biosynthesis C-methylase UbiE
MARQLRKPSGWFGSLVISRSMNRLNRRITNRALELLEIRPDNQVLEIGFGGGIGLEAALQRLDAGTITGIDLSPDMVRDAERRFRREIGDGSVCVQIGDIARLPYPDTMFDRVFSINTIYFWPDTTEGFSQILRVLKKGGRAAIGLRSRDKMQWSGFGREGYRLFTPQEVLEHIQTTGFCDCRLDHRYQDRAYDDVIVVGTR